MKTLIFLICKYLNGNTLYDLHLTCKDVRDIVQNEVYSNVTNGILSLFKKNMGNLSSELVAMLQRHRAVISGSIVPMLALKEDWVTNTEDMYIPDVDVYLRSSIENIPTYDGYYCATEIDDLLLKRSQYYYSHHLRKNMYRGFEGISQVRTFYTAKPRIQTITVTDGDDLVDWIRSNFDIDILMNAIEFTKSGMRLTIAHPRKLLTKNATVVGFKNIGTTVSRIAKYEKRGFAVSRDDAKMREIWKEQFGEFAYGYDEHSEFFAPE